MSTPVLYYFDGRGRAEILRWMLAACNIEVGLLMTIFLSKTALLALNQQIFKIAYYFRTLSYLFCVLSFKN